MFSINQNNKISKLLGIFIVFFSVNTQVFAQELHQDVQNIWRAEVKNILLEEVRSIEGTKAKANYQKLEAEIIEGELKGKYIELENDFLKLEKGDRFFISHIETVTGEEFFTVFDADRRGPLLFLFGLFILSVLLIGGRQGVRSIISLIGSFFVILYALVPALLSGYPPVPTSVVLSSLILVLAIFTTHGVNRLSIIALTGTISSVSLTGFLAYFSVKSASLTGHAVDEAIYLNFNYPNLDLEGLLLGGVIIGILGVLDDISITQVAVVGELFKTAPNLAKREIYSKALKIGREHVGALVNTLALAYVGASLPLLLLFSGSDAPAWTIINREIFASEIIRTIVGSIGLILTVPITTLLAVFFLKDSQVEIKHHTHSH